MISFISSFRAPLIAICLIAAVEICVYQAGIGVPINNNNLLDYSYLKNIRPEKILAVNKLEYTPKDSTFIQVGDSSGLVAVDPAIMKKYLHAGYYNGSLQMPLGFPSYRYSAELYLQRAAHPEFLVYHISPHQELERKKRMGWSDLVYRNTL